MPHALFKSDKTSLVITADRASGKMRITTSSLDDPLVIPSEHLELRMGGQAQAFPPVGPDDPPGRAQ
jgi:hypothetical protein